MICTFRHFYYENFSELFPTGIPTSSRSLSRDKIYFLKTHKTGSSTVENILLRIALKYNKTIARPKNGGLNFDNYSPFGMMMVRPILVNGRFSSPMIPSVVAQHTLFSAESLQMYPKGEAFKFSVLRVKW